MIIGSTTLANVSSETDTAITTNSTAAVATSPPSISEQTVSAITITTASHANNNVKALQQQHDTTATSTTSSSNSNDEQYQEEENDDIFLSLSNPLYKSVLFQHFQQMTTKKKSKKNDTTSSREEEREEEKRVAIQIASTFKKEGGTRRFFKRRSRSDYTYVEVDFESAVKKINDDVRRRGENAKQWQTTPKSSNFLDDSNSVGIKSDKSSSSMVESVSAEDEPLLNNPIPRKSKKKSKTQLKLPSTKAKNSPHVPNSITTNADATLASSNSTRVKSPRPNKNALATTAPAAKATASTTVANVVSKARTSSSYSSTKARTSKRVKSNVDNTAAAATSTTTTRVGSVGEDTKASLQLLQVGDRVEAKYQGRGRRWYKGTVVNIVQNLNGGLYDIDYDDGDRDRSLNQEFIRRVTTPSEATSTTTIVAKPRSSSSRASVAKAKVTSKVSNETTPTHWQCPECSQEFVFTFQKTMAASMANHLKKHKPKDEKATAKKKTKTTKRKTKIMKKKTTSTKSSSRLDAKEPTKKKAAVTKGEPIKKKRGRPRKLKLTVTFSEEEPAKKRRKNDHAAQAVTPSQFTMSKRSTTSSTTNYITPTPQKESKESHHLLPNVSPIVVVESTSSAKKEGKTVCFAQNVHVMATDATKALRWNNDGDATVKDDKASKETTKAQGEHEYTFCSFDNIKSSPFGKANAENDRENILAPRDDVGIGGYPLEQVQEDVSADELSSFQYSPIKMSKQVKSNNILQHSKSSQDTSAFASCTASNSSDVYPCDGQGSWAQQVLMSKPSAEVMQPLFSPLKLPAIFQDLPFPQPIMHIPSNEHDVYQFLEEIGDDLFDFD